MEIAIVMSIGNILCFLIGAIVGQRVRQEKPIVDNPIKVIEHHIEEKEYKDELNKYSVILDNINNYDGYGSIGQKDIPR